MLLGSLLLLAGCLKAADPGLFQALFASAGDVSIRRMFRDTRGRHFSLAQQIA